MRSELREFDNPELRMLLKVSTLRRVELLETDVRSQALAAGSRRGSPSREAWLRESHLPKACNPGSNPGLH